MATDLNDKIDKAVELYEKGDLQKSLNLCRKLLEADPDNVYVLINIGNIYYVQNDYVSASVYYQKAVDADPYNYSALINLANSYFELKNYMDAIHYARNAVECRPTEKLAYIILGNSYFEMEKYQDSIAALEAAQGLDSNDPWVYNYLSQSYQKISDYIKAVSNAWKAVEKSAEKDDSHHINLGYLFYEIALDKGADSIAECVRLWVKKYNANPLVSYMGNALLGNTEIKAADPRYLRDVFDVFASDFDTVLASLDYRAPGLINSVLKDLYKKKKTFGLRILDMGCGTGLCGVFLKKYASLRRLDGVDISEKMLEAAGKKKLYTKLYNAELSAFLESCRNYDLMVAADVFTYIGELDYLFGNIALKLNKKGRVIFTVSANEIDGRDYYLHISGRFLHSVEYVKKVLKNAGLEMEICDYKKLRNEGDKPVMGYIVSAVRK